MWSFPKDQALCLNDEFADAWFPDDDERKTDAYTERAEYAISVCNCCKVRLECLQFAIDMTADKQHGVLGGLTAAARKEARLGKRYTYS